MVLGSIRTLVAQGVSKPVAVARFAAASAAAHRVSRWASEWLAEVREKVASGERSATYLAELERWFESDGHIGAWWGKRSIHDVRYSTVGEWSRWLAADRKLGPKTRHNVMGGLHALIGWLWRAEQIPAVPPFPWPTVDEHAPRIVSRDVQTRILAAIRGDRRGIFLAMTELGLRPSEARRLRACDYASGSPPWITVPHTKTRRVKRLPVPAVLEEWIETHVPRASRLAQRPLFVRPQTQPAHPAGAWSKSAMTVEWKVACERAGVPHVGLYEGTKHSTATEFLRRGIHERVIQALLGHADVRSTRRYARLADHALVEALIPGCGSNVDPRRRRRATTREVSSSGGPPRTRTGNRRVKSPLLYRLS